MTRKRYLFTAHAKTVMVERHIKKEWAERILDHPEMVVEDRADPELRHAVGRIAEYGDRVLRVVYNEHADSCYIVTVYFDRSLRDKL